MRKQYESKILKSIHEDAQELFKAGIIDAKRMAEFDQDCFIQEHEKSAAEIPKAKKEKVKTPA